MLVLTPDFPPATGGIQTLTHRIAGTISALRVKVVTLREPEAAAFDRRSPLATSRVGARWLPNRVNVGLLDLGGVAAGLRFRPDVILSAHVVCAPATALLRRVLGVPVLQYVHADEVSARPRLARFAAGHAELLVAVSAHARDLIRRQGADDARVVVIHPGVDAPAAAAGGRRAVPTIVTVAGLHYRYKGHDVMLRALRLVRARVPDVEWVVVGDGPLSSLYRAMAREYGLQDHVRFCGHVTAAQRDRWLDEAHVFAMPSRLRLRGRGGEGFGLAYLEAGAHGLPVVAGSVGGALDAVRDGETGVLVDPTDHVAVADALIDVLRDPDRAARLGAAGARLAATRTWAVAGGQVERLLLELLER